MNLSTLRRRTVVIVAGCMSFVLMACGSSVQGVYTDTTGAYRLALQSGGKASFQAGGAEQDCTYTVSGKKLHLKCGSDTTDFDIHDDGALTNDSPLFPALRKTKS
jgi:hypothetical protein